MNTRQKPADQLQGKGSRHAGSAPRVLTPLPPGERRIPKPPAGLTKGARDAWRAFWLSPVAQAVDLNADGVALRRWIVAVSKRDALEAEFEQERTTKGSTGQDRLNPIYATLKELEKTIAHYEEAFGMTPLARMRLGIAISQGKSSIDELKARLAERASAPQSAAGVLDLEGLG